jgi:hypothetical protein
LVVASKLQDSAQLVLLPLDTLPDGNYFCVLASKGKAVVGFSKFTVARN